MLSQENEGLSTREILHEFILFPGCHCSRSSCSYTLPCKQQAYWWADSGGMSNTHRLFPSQGKSIWKFWNSILCMAMCLEKENYCFLPCSLLTSHKRSSTLKIIERIITLERRGWGKALSFIDHISCIFFIYCLVDWTGITFKNNFYKYKIHTTYHFYNVCYKCML